MEYVSKIDRSYLLWFSLTALRIVLFNGPGVMYIHIYTQCFVYMSRIFRGDTVTWHYNVVTFNVV